ncbi:MAG TPA: apolipoprotein N-acyltransferase, partial [Phycisphaerales bacterium]|nr:apolipoprotein N-acyltransferase [Phycisphaerales bacterium]
WKLPLACALLHTLFMILAFDPVGLWPCALLSVAPLVYAAIRTAHPAAPHGHTLSARRLFFITWLGTYPLYAFEQGWTIEVALPGYPFMVAIMSCYAPAMILLLRRVHRRFPRLPLTLLGALTWTTLEILEGDILFKGYGWFNSVHPLADFPPVAAPAAIVGLYGTTFLAAGISACIASLIATRQRRELFSGAAILLAWVSLAIAGWQTSSATSNPSVRIAVIQTNLPQSNKISPDYKTTLGLWQDLESLSTQAAGSTPRPDVIVWPETMKPGMALDPPSVDAERRARIALFDRANPQNNPILTADFAANTTRLQAALNIPILVGEDAYDGLNFSSAADGSLDIHYKHRFNSAFLVTAGSVSGTRYDKVRLTPFGEEMPYISAWPWLESKLLDLAARGMRLDLSAGDHLTVFEIPTAAGIPARLVTPICFEATEWDLCRKLVYDGSTRRADVMVNMTNDGWFGDWWRAGRAQHMQIARWRCIELATPMIRAANTGISSSIDQHGRLTRIEVGPDRRDWKVSGVYAADIPFPAATSLFARGGWLTSWVILALGLLLWFSTLIPRSADSRTNAKAAA